MKEEWKPISQYKGIYEISNLGNVRSVDRIVRYKRIGKLHYRFFKGKPKKTVIDVRPNRMTVEVVLRNKYNKLRKHNVAQLVAQHFVEKENPLHYEIEFIDGNKQNCKANNLKYRGSKKDGTVLKEYHRKNNGMRWFKIPEGQ